MSRDRTVAQLVAAARDGDARAVGRLISEVEDAGPNLREAIALLAPHTGQARVIGLTGAPGVGKSTSTGALVTALRARGDRVGVLAIDPSSPFSGGALLGDRIRMQDHATDTGVFIRSMASRGHLGGLSRATPQALRVLDGAGFDTVLIETVGVGQAEVEIAGMADTTLVLLAPGMGDGIQAAKAGILEVADILVVNKADRDGAAQTIRELQQMLRMGEHPAGGWRVPVVSTVASRAEGVAELLAELDRHADWLTTTGTGKKRRTERAAGEVEAIALSVLRARMGDLRGGSQLTTLATDVAAGQADPFEAADELIQSLGLAASGTAAAPAPAPAVGTATATATAAVGTSGA